MNKKKLIVGLSFIVIFQIFILAAEYTNAVYPLWTGQEIKLNTIPVDPRSLFRGNYARLGYDISQIPGVDINGDRIPRNGEIVYVTLKTNENGIYLYHGASLKKPESGIFIRGRIQTNSWPNTSKKYTVKYGIEALFAPREKAMQLEKELQNPSIANVMLASNGKATLKAVVKRK